MRDSGLPLFVSLFPSSSRNPLPDIWLRNACSGVTSVLHELRDLAKVTRKNSAKAYTCQKSVNLKIVALVLVALGHLNEGLA
jgi:hypothetical protein